MKNVSVKDQSFINRNNEMITLHGINMVCKDKTKNYLGDYSEADFETLARLGFNVVRFGIFWDAIEPEPGKYNDTYLLKVKEYSKIAEKYGIVFYLDMHQDLFSADFCDGAPSWATNAKGESYEQTELWSEAYLTSPAVQNAFDSFWENADAGDGEGLRDHYAKMWQHIAALFKDDPNVIGYDCFNEPFPGGPANNLIGMLFMSLAESLSAEASITPEQIMAIWMDNEQKAALLSKFNDKAKYEALVHPLAAALEEFDSSILTGFYQQMRDAIRAIDEEALLFVEANYFCNTGIPSNVIPPKDIHGNTDTLTVYAPHGYDLMVDTDLYSSDCFTRLDVIFETHKAYAERFKLPVLVGEWGCYPNANAAQKKEAAYLLKKFKQLGFSNTYYDYSTLDGNPISEILIC